MQTDFTKDMLKRINKLPHELVNEIYNYLPKTTLVWLTYDDYCKYHSVIYDSLRMDQESYTRYLLRHDFDLPFSLHLRENFRQWLAFKKYSYKKKIFKDYFTFIWEFSKECQATKCKNLMAELLV